MEVQQQERSLFETPAYAVASVVTVMVFVCFLVERSIYRFGEWLEKTKRKALLASLGKIKEEQDVGVHEMIMLQYAPSAHNVTANLGSIYDGSSPHQCEEGLEPLISYEGLEQLHRFLFVLGITHVFYTCVAVGLAMCKIYSWRKWENQANLGADGNIVAAKKQKVMRRQCTFVFNHTYHPWSKNHILIWMLCFLRQFKSSIQNSDYLALRLGFITAHELPPCYDFHSYMIRSMEDEFQCILGISWLLWAYTIFCISINIHGLNTYFWLSFMPAIVKCVYINIRLVMLLGTKLQHVVSSLALGMEQTTASNPSQLKPRDDHFWFRRPEILFRLIQFVIFQNAFEMATFIWSLWVLQERSCFMKDHNMIAIRLACGVLILLWCSYMTVPLNVIISQMGSRYKKAVVAESVRESLHKWRERAKERPKHDLQASRSVYCLDTIVEMDDKTLLESGALSNQITTVNSVVQLNSENTKAADDDVPCQTKEFSTDESVNGGADHVGNEAEDRT